MAEDRERQHSTSTTTALTLLTKLRCHSLAAKLDSYSEEDMEADIERVVEWMERREPGRERVQTTVP